MQVSGFGKLTSAVTSVLLGKVKELHSTANGLCKKTAHDNGVGGAILSIGVLLELLDSSNAATKTAS